MTRFVTPFLVANPNIELQLYTTHDRAGSKKALYDLQIQYTEPTDPGLIAMRIANLHFMLFASTEYIQAHGVPLQFEDLVHHRLLDLTLGLTQKGTFATWANYSKSPVMFTNSTVALGESARMGAGIALLPSYAALVDRALVPLLPGLSFPTPVYLCFERGARDKAGRGSHAGIPAQRGFRPPRHAVVRRTVPHSAATLARHDARETGVAGRRKAGEGLTP